MKTTLQVELHPFQVPDFVTQVMPPGNREDGFKEAPKYALSQLDPRTLDELCQEFRREVFEKAKKHPPPEVVCR